MSMSTLKYRWLCLAGLAAYSYYKIKQNKVNKRQKRFWVKGWLAKRDHFSHINLIRELDPSDYQNYLRMPEELYQNLLEMVTPLIQKKDTPMRAAITAHERLTVTLRYLATGRTYTDLQYSSIISKQALSEIIPETCDAIYKVLKEEYMKFPATAEQWKTVAEEFNSRWNFPHCLGSVDGKHIRIVARPNSGSLFYNYKGYHSIVLMAIVNANYEFIMIDVGCNGRISDAGVIDHTEFYSLLKENKLNLPSPIKPTPNSQELPYVFIGDEILALRTDFLKPFSKKVLNHDRKIFNYRLSRARRIVENAFGILANRFRIFHTPIQVVNTQNIIKIVMTACTLHNYLRKHASFTYMQSDFDSEIFETGEITEGLRPEQMMPLEMNRRHRNATQNAKKIRDDFMTFFNNEGSVPWQENMIHE